MDNLLAVCNILMYSYDTYGLGHIRQSMVVANHLCDHNTNILILTGSPIAGRFPFPEQVDFVRIPGIIEKTDGDYQSRSIRVGQEQALNIRTNIILATAQMFRPNFFIVDREPQGLKREVLPTLEWLKEHSPETRSILGLHDIPGDARVICREWREKSVYRTLAKLYDEIWIYGERNIYDPIEEYRLPEDVGDKVVFTGYLPTVRLPSRSREKIRRQYRLMDDDPLVLVTIGGGGDGDELIRHFLDMHEYFRASLPFRSIIVTGPFMPGGKREETRRRAARHGIQTFSFHPHMEELMTAADVVVSLGGYNTICEILTHGTPALIIPREQPRLEQFIRATRLGKLHLLDFLPWDKVHPLLLREKILSLIDNRLRYRMAMADFRLSGLKTIRSRIDLMKERQAIASRSAAETATPSPAGLLHTFREMAV